MNALRIAAISFVLLMITSAAAIAAPPASPPAMPPLQATATPNERVAEAIAKYFGVPTATILEQHKQGAGYGEIVIAYALAQKSGGSASDLLALHASGQGWGEIAKTTLSSGKWGMGLGQIMRNAKKDASTASGKSGDQGQDQGKGKGKDNNNGKGKDKNKD
jgi:hypothetical protein